METRCIPSATHTQTHTHTRRLVEKAWQYSMHSSSHTYRHTSRWQIYRTSTFSWGYCFRAAHPREPSWQHQCLCSVRGDFTVHHISEHLSGLLILEAASGYRWAITNGIKLNKTRSTGVSSACFMAVFLHSYGSVKRPVKGWHRVEFYLTKCIIIILTRTQV